MPPPRRLRGPLHPSQLALRNTTSLLNKLAEANFDTISAQIIALVEQSAAKDDGGTISMLSQTCLDAAVAQTPRVDLYARLCRAVLEQSSTLLFASGPRTSEGKTMTGGQAFRYYLLNPLYRRVQAGDTSDTSKRHYLGTVKFLADLAREDMVPVAKMHECIKNSLSAAAFLSQIDLEAVCIILKTSGSLLDVPESRVQMEVYFERIEDLKRSTMIPARSRFMLQDICDLRARQWVALQSTVEQDLGLT
ncbi:armadillo-type protein, partial [Mycena filopes]